MFALHYKDFKMNNSILFALENLKVTRKNVISFLEQFSFEQLVEVPKGFNNSVLWNAFHNLATQQILCYKLSGLPFRIDSKFIDGFTKGADGKALLSEEDFETFKSLLLSSITELKEDYENGLFKEFQEYTTSYNITLRNIEEAISFNNTHEGLHLGYMMSMRKLIG